MDYHDFIEHLRGLLLLALDKREEQIYFKRVAKSDNYTEDELFICNDEDGHTTIAGIYLKQIYEDYRSGKEMGDLIEDIKASVAERGRINDGQFFRDFMEYEKAGSSLIIRTLSFPNNQKLLEDYIYKRTGDIALVVYAVLCKDPAAFLSFKVSRRIAESWGVSEDQIWKDALHNTKRMFPPRIYSFQALLGDAEEPGEFMGSNPDIILDTTESGNCLTNAMRMNGAVSVFLPGVANRIGKLFNDDFYIAFTSIHEAMIHCAVGSNPEHIRAALEGMNPYLEEDGSEFLSSHVYFYSIKNKEFKTL